MTLIFHISFPPQSNYSKALRTNRMVVVRPRKRVQGGKAGVQLMALYQGAMHRLHGPCYPAFPESDGLLGADRQFPAEG